MCRKPPWSFGSVGDFPERELVLDLGLAVELASRGRNPDGGQAVAEVFATRGDRKKEL